MVLSILLFFLTKGTFFSCISGHDGEKKKSIFKSISVLSPWTCPVAKTLLRHLSTCNYVVTWLVNIKRKMSFNSVTEVSSEVFYIIFFCVVSFSLCFCGTVKSITTLTKISDPLQSVFRCICKWRAAWFHCLSPGMLKIRIKAWIFWSQYISRN